MDHMVVSLSNTVRKDVPSPISIQSSLLSFQYLLFIVSTSSPTRLRLRSSSVERNAPDWFLLLIAFSDLFFIPFTDLIGGLVAHFHLT